MGRNRYAFPATHEEREEFFKSMGYEKAGWMREGIYYENEDAMLRDILDRVVTGELSIMAPPVDPPVAPAVEGGWSPAETAEIQKGPGTANIPDDDIPF